MSLFSQTPEVKYDYDKNIEPRFLKFLERIEELDKTRKEIGRFINKKDLEWGANVSEYNRGLYKAKKEVENIEKHIKEIKEKFMKMIDVFKMKAMKEDFEKLKKDLEHLNYQEYMTREEFKELIS